MFHLLNKNLNLQLFLLILLLGWAAWTIFARMTVLPPEGTMLLFQYVTKAWVWNSFAVRLVVLIIVLAITFAIVHHGHKNHFSENRSYMPGIFLLLLLNCGKFLYNLTPALLTVFFIALIMIVYQPNEQAVKMKDRLFSLGLLIAISTLLDISAFGIVLFLIMVIAINNVTSFKDILILLLGLSFPYIYAFSIAFISDQTLPFVQSWRELEVFAPITHFTKMRVVEYVAIACFVLVTVILMVRDKRLFDNRLIVIRQAFNNVNLLLISMTVFLFLGIVPLPAALLYLLQPVAHYMSVAVSHKRYRFLMDFLIIALCVLLCF